jgi:hypothetical protein
MVSQRFVSGTPTAPMPKVRGMGVRVQILTARRPASTRNLHMMAQASSRDG